MPGRQLPLFPDAVVSPTLRDISDAVRVAGLDGLPDARRRSDEARYQEVRVRSAVTSTKGMPFSWALNPYRGCTHACEYCYARKYQRHLELGTGDDFSGVILVKTNVAEVLAREMTRPGWARELVAIGTATDPYQPIEGYYRLTRRCLEVLADAHTPFSIVTKGPMVVRDTDLLIRATTRAGCRVYLSVPSVDDEMCAQLEPGVAPPAQRLRAAKQLADAGVDTGILMMPLVPGLTTSREQIRNTVEAIAATGVRLIGANVTHLEAGVREHFFAFLEREHPSLLAGYARLYKSAYAAPEYVASVKAVVDEARATCRVDQSNIRNSNVAEPRPRTGSAP